MLVLLGGVLDSVSKGDSLLEPVEQLVLGLEALFGVDVNGCAREGVTSELDCVERLKQLFPR